MNTASITSISFALVALVGASSCRPHEPPIDYQVMYERPAGGGGAEAEALVSENVTIKELDSLLVYLDKREWPKGSLNVLVFDSLEAQRAHRKCIVAWRTWPVSSPGDPPGCADSRSFGKPPYIASLNRNHRDERSKYFDPTLKR